MAAVQQQVREWTLGAELGRGGMGVVVRARHAMLPAEYAVKVIRPELASDPEVRARFMREAATANALRHENVVKTDLPFDHEGRLYLPMELLHGTKILLPRVMNGSPGPAHWTRA